MKNKKSIMAFSAMQILIFHLWINIFGNNNIEMFLKQTAYIGVDIFFLLSGYSLASRNIGNYKKFLLARFKAIYIKFIIFAIVVTIYKHYSLVQLLKIISGLDLLNKGGGAFLWFIPSIMIFYIMFPLFKHYENRHKIITPLVLTIVWIIVATVITSNKEIKQLAIVWNRIPVFIIGYYLLKLNEITKVISKKHISIILGIILTIIGTIIIYKFAYKVKLNSPIINMFYLTVIPSSIGLTMLISNIKEVKPIRLIGESTLEIYAIQMIFGYDIANRLLQVIHNRLAVNLIIIISILSISIIWHYAYDYIIQRIKNYNNIIIKRIIKK